MLLATWLFVVGEWRSDQKFPPPGEQMCLPMRYAAPSLRNIITP